jgi:hypothetical protein
MSTINLSKSKIFAYFPLTRSERHSKRWVQKFFVATETCLPSHCLATIGSTHTDTQMCFFWLHYPGFQALGGIHRHTLMRSHKPFTYLKVRKVYKEHTYSIHKHAYTHIWHLISTVSMKAAITGVDIRWEYLKCFSVEVSLITTPETEKYRLRQEPGCRFLRKQRYVRLSVWLSV